MPSKKAIPDTRVEEVLKRLDAAKEFGYDAETSGLDWRKNHIVGHVLTFGPAPQDTYYIPVRHQPGGNIPGCEVPQTADGWKGDIHPFEVELTKRIDRQGKTMIGHNLGFDTKFLSQIGVEKFDMDVDDTQINAALINELQAGFSLDVCARIAGVPLKKTSIYEYLASKFPEAKGKGAMGHFWRLAGDDPQAVDYASGDGVSTWGLREWQRKEIEYQGLEKVHGIESKLLPILTRMSIRGIRIDEERLAEIKEIAEKRVKKGKEQFPEDFNPFGPKHVKTACELAGRMDWPYTAPSKRFPNGQPSFPEKWLKTFPVGKSIVDIRKFQNMQNSFIDPMINEHLWFGRVHTEYNQLRGDEYGTITGRLSSSHPNLQQVPKHNWEIGCFFRSIFAPDEGMEWASVDYSQCEPRLLAFYSGARVLLDGYNANPPVDAHLAVSMASCGPRWDTMSADERKRYRDDFGKRINQTIVTGGGKGVLVEKYGVPADEVDKVWNDYHRAMPEVGKLQREALNSMRREGYVFTLLGRKCRLERHDLAYKATNRLLQGGNADILKVKLIEVDDLFRSSGPGIDLLNNAHDSFEIQFEPSKRKVLEEAMRVMTSFGPDDVIDLQGIVPMVVDAGFGPHWAIATYGAKKYKEYTEGD